MIRFPERFHASETPGAGEIGGRRIDLEALEAHVRARTAPSPHELKAVTAPNLREVFGFDD